MSITHLGSFEMLSLLLWKNFWIHIYHRWHLCLVILSPLILDGILIIIRLFIKASDEPEGNFDSIDLNESWRKLVNEMAFRREQLQEYNEHFEYNAFVPQMIVAYAPSSIEAYVNIVKKAADKLGEVEIKGFENCDSLRKQMWDNSYFAGICFSESSADSKKNESEHLISIYPNQLKYTLIFPSEVRMYFDTLVGYTWSTGHLYDQITDRRNQTDADGGYVGYIREGFIPLQNAVSTAYIELITNKSDIIDIKMQRLPLGRYDYDPVCIDMTISITNIIHIGLILSVLYFSMLLISEREKKLHDTLIFSGAKNWIQFIAWFLPAYLILSIESFLFIITIKINGLHQYPILPNTSWLILFFVLLIYNISALCFTFMISSLFTKTHYGIPAMGLLWYYSNFPFMLYITSMEPNDIYKIVICLFSNSTMGLILFNISKFDKFDNGFNWSNLFNETDDKNSVALYIIILTVSSIIYMAIGLISLELQSSFKSRKTKEYQNERRHSTHDENRFRPSSIQSRKTKVYEISSEPKNCTVQIKELIKTYDTQPILYNINLELFENEVTALIGHNGSGKSILLSIVIGLCSPSGGTILRNDLNISNLPKNLSPSVGFCLQDVCLFEELTVENQMTFFARKCDLSWKEVRTEVERFLKKSHLSEFQNTITKNLDPAKIKVLAVCCALIGNNKFIILDDPMSGLDLISRRNLWELINSEKKYRTILLATHAIHDAEYFADRIAILSDGELTCSGTTKFLKKLYGVGFRLIFTKNAQCDVDEVTAAVKNYIPDIEPECDVANELSYIIDETYIDILGVILEYFEGNLESLGLNNCLIREFNLEDIFFKMGAQYSGEGEISRHSDIMNGLSTYSRDYKEFAFLIKKPKLYGCSLFMQQWITLLRKRFIYSTSSVTLTFAQFLLPVFLICVAFIIINARMTRLPLPAMTYELGQYGNTFTVLNPKQNLVPFSRNISEKYEQLIFWEGMKHGLLKTNDQSLEQFVTEDLTFTKLYANRNVIIGATIGNKQLIAWFNNYPLHSAPLSLNMLHKSILRCLLDDDANIEISFNPLPYVTKHNLPLGPFNLGYINTITITFTSTFVFHFCVIFIIKERDSKLKLMQLIAGVRLTTYWLSSLLYDIIRISIICLIILFVILMISNSINFQSMDLLLYYSSIIGIAGACTTTFDYLMSRFYNNPILAFNSLLFISLCGCSALASVLTDLQWNQKPFTLSYATQFWHIFPTFNMGMALYKIYQEGNLRLICADKYTNLIGINLEQCHLQPNCCVTFNLWNFKDGILLEATIMLAFTAINLSILFYIEYRNLRCSKVFMPQIPLDNEKSAHIEHKNFHSDQFTRHSDDLIYEKIKVQRLNSRDYQNTRLVWNHVGRFDNTNNVDKILRYYFMIERGECIGLTGRNNCGKSQILKMIVGEQAMHFGIAHVNGISFDEPLPNIWKNMSYAVQECNMFDELTVKETLELFGALNGIPKKNITNICENISKAFEFYEYYHRTLDVCSIGIKKRVCNALAFLGNSQLIVLDEPSTDVDIAARRILWRVISIIQQRNDTVILSSLEPRDCERVCTRVAILSKGEILCLHCPNVLIRRYLNGFILIIRLKFNTYRTSKAQTVRHKSFTDPFYEIGRFIDYEFHNSLLKEQFDNVQVYYIPQESLNLTSIFKTMRDNAMDLNIDNFNITRANLSTLYLQVLQQQDF